MLITNSFQYSDSLHDDLVEFFLPRLKFVAENFCERFNTMQLEFEIFSVFASASVSARLFAGSFS